jgi:hypothetical protein
MAEAGVATAVVVENKDGSGTGRVKVRYPGTSVLRTAIGHAWRRRWPENSAASTSCTMDIKAAGVLTLHGAVVNIN